jgi:hypothetical protein
MGEERRRHKRTKVMEQPLVLDASGRMLGRASIMGEGGMQLDASTKAIADELGIGRRLQLEVVHPGKERFHVEAEVKYRQGDSLGVEYVGARTASSM